ncbi:root hair specific 2 [Striga hermonthica]|uniref:Root hair specific 2 n=1 Tax=Striga hermonthica TaxID=68872 RepID=A0A9N7NZ79_STRHE|nr:root hair specific 2 [Striga hermonthica]
MESKTMESGNSICVLPAVPADINESDEFHNIIISIPQHEHQQQQQQQPLPLEDISPINSFGSFFSEFKNESSKLWRLAAPAILTTVFQYSLGAITQTFAGHMGMGSALETLCGQAYGAGKIGMLGVYMQRSWIILLATSVLLTFLYAFAEPVLLLLRQKEDISRAAGRIARWMIPQLYAYAFNFPMAKFLQAQSKIAWAGFSYKAFHSLWAFVKLSVASAVMLCLEVWYFTALILFAGYLKNAEVAVDSLSICVNILGWTGMVALGFNAAVSVRVSNELGADRPRTAKFAVVVVVISSFVIAVLISVFFLAFQKQYPTLFSNSLDVKNLVYHLTPMLAFCIVLNNVQPALSGVAIGAGWQAIVAYVNIGSYYLFGIPLGLTLGYAAKLGVRGIWYGMAGGTAIQTLILLWLIYRTNWKKEASAAAERINTWGGESAVRENNIEN